MDRAPAFDRAALPPIIVRAFDREALTLEDVLWAILIRERLNGLNFDGMAANVSDSEFDDSENSEVPEVEEFTDAGGNTVRGRLPIRIRIVPTPLNGPAQKRRRAVMHHVAEDGGDD